jgi:hypothetical protein
MQDLDSERRKLMMVQRQLREVEGSSSAAAVQAGEVAALRETVAALTADLKVLSRVQKSHASAPMHALLCL